MANDRIKQLLSTSSNADSGLTQIKDIMKMYIASPWDAVNNKILDENQYNKYLNEYKDKYETGTDNTKLKLCQSNTDDETIKNYKQILCQSHSGNLFEHSQWAALQILKWHIDNDPIMDGLDLETTIIAAFFHDIGKGGDCVNNCNTNGLCWFDMYSNDKYDKKGDAVHPTYCSDMILGKIDFIVNCTTKQTINIKELLLKIYPNLNIEKIALAALMHWEFGKLNIKNEYSEKIKIKNYLDMFFNSCQTLGLNPNDKLLKLCIAVACADITAGTNKRLLPSVDGIIPEKEVFLGKDPFVLFGMDKKYIDYRQSLIDAFNIRVSMRGGGGNDSNDGVKKILMFSDIEGCQADPGKQSTFLCSTPFYDEIARRLKDDRNLEVSFLGDYFDQGLGVFNSINKMYQLLLKYPERVHIILGNRDVNKLRFMFELTNNVRGLTPNEKRWGVWSKYYDGLVGKTGVALVKHILSTSMGAGKSIGDKMVGLHSFVPVGAKGSASDEIAYNYLLAAFRLKGSKPEFTPLDLLSFFSKCKIAHVFNGKVLLAHGGGFDPQAFFGQKYIDSFSTDEPVTGENYHQLLNDFRVRLSSDPDGDSYHVSVEDSVNVYNNLLQEVLREISGENPVFTWKFVLLQALGLKPDDEDARYKSLIQSCSQDGCKGPNIPLSTDPIDETTKTTKLATILEESGITHVSYGHKPICFPTPFIYKREEVPGVTFISNDTSNGNRKVDEVGNNTAIGTMVIFDPNGVKSKIEPVDLNSEKREKGEKVPYEEKVGIYEAMYAPLTLDTTPFYEIESDAYVLKYGDGKVVFNKSGYNQLNYIGSSNSGGKRRSRHRKQHKSKRGSKRGGSKKTIHRRRHKHTKRGRKARK